MAEKFFKDQMIWIIDDDIDKCPVGELGVEVNVGTFYYKDVFDITHAYSIGTVVDVNVNEDTGYMECTTETGLYLFKPIPNTKEK